MTVILSADRGSAPGGAPDDRVPDGIGVRDFGATLVRPIDAVRQAADACLVDCSLHDATRIFGALADDLTAAEPDIDAWPDRFAADARRVRDDFAARIPDGPPRDRFDAGFDLFAKAKAVETRALATHKRIAFNRAELDRALAGYGDAISRATNPVTADFALTQGETAIRNQVAAQVLSEEQGAALSQRFRGDIALRRARQFIEDDPAAAAQELAKEAGGLFSDLDPDHRMRLAEQARQIAGARDADTARRAEDDGRRQAVATALRRDAFLRDLDDRREDGRATLGDIAGAARDGILGPVEADARLKTLEIELAARERVAARVAGLMDRPGDLLDPGDADDRLAAEVHWKDVVEPLSTGLPPADRARIEDGVVFATGIAPGAAVIGLRADLLSGDPAARVAAARRIRSWQTAHPPVPVELPEFERRQVDALTPYLDLPLPDARKTELADRATA
tara:strand:- start:4405 stop:5763 length:1359 start_codon:yes stop_codon:yes gene_type:complete